ncbi:hypothetical protein LPYR103PRE_24030 [Segatella asaccharophila]
MVRSDILKLRPSVAVVANDDFTEFFLSDIRKSVTLKMDKNVSTMLFSLDGKASIDQWMKLQKLSDDQYDDISNLLSFLNQQHVLIKIDEDYLSEFKVYPRVFSLLENYYSSHNEINNVFKRLRGANVMIIGLGSVGTWVAKCLSMDGVQNFILVDDDKVESSNLHRQLGFTEESIGKKKTDAFTSYLKGADPVVNVIGINDRLNGGFFKRHEFGKINLIINCADSPTVDKTSRIVGEYAMAKGIAHCIGGGYNLHQSLIGQIVIPDKTACLECFRKNMDELNVIDTTNIRKLENKNRKLGSFPPLSSLSASITANEAFKYLAGLHDFVMTNTRAEFSINDLNFHQLEMCRREDCKWCGIHGKYYQL